MFDRQRHSFLFVVIPLSIVIFFHSFSFSQTIGNGADGSPNISGVVNRYTPLHQVQLTCREDIEVGDATLFSVGDLVLIIQMQGAQIDGSNSPSYGAINSYGNAGNYEFSKVVAIPAHNILRLQNPLIRKYDTAGKVQAIRVPQYVRPVVTGTLSCKPWDGSTGGVLAIDATDTIILQAGMDVSGLGFRGGQVYTGPEFNSDSSWISEFPSLFADGTKGEGIAFNGLAPYTDGRGAPANGGGGGNSHTGGGGGGANLGCGGTGGWGFPVDGRYKTSLGSGGHTLDYSLTFKTFMGGGGGAGSSHADEGTSGGNGGGIIIITANSMTSNHNALNAYGDSSLGGGSPTHADGIGGGGAGGTVLLALNSISDPLQVNVFGGNGGNPSLLGAGPGGGGGGGLCYISAASLQATISLDSSGGIGGNAKGNNYGATNGCPGGLLSGLVIHLNPAIPSSKAAFTTTSSNSLGTDVTTINNSTNATFYHWNFGDGNIDTSLNPTHNYLLPGIYEVVLVANNTMNCADSASQVIITAIANVFTPNEDGKNDIFGFPVFDTKSYSSKFSIFNRWGRLIFSGNDENSKWDGNINGKKASNGVYYYVLEISDKESGTKTIKKGNVTLLR